GGGLWVSDGTAAGTNELKSFGAYGNANPPSNFVPFGGEVLFTAGGRIWVSDGTVAGTSEIINLLPLDTSNLTVFGNLVLFCAGGNIWSTDGTFPGTHQLTGLSGTSNQSFSVMQGFTIFNKMALFSGIDANNDYGIWVTDGTALGTKEIATFGGIIWVPPPRNFIAINNKVFLTQGTGLFITDGTSAGTYNLNNSAFGLYSSGALVAFNNEVVFTGIDMTGAEGLWITDGTDAGTHEFFRESGFFFRVGDIVCFDNKILFNDGKGSLSISDGTAAGTHALIGIVGAASNGLSLGPSDMTVFNNEVLFNGYNASRKQGLWVTDGTAAGTHELSGISGANASLNPQHISVIAPAFSIAYFLTKQATLDKIAGGFAISDTAQHIEHDLWALLADASYINSITASGLVGVSAATFVADRAVLDKISGGFGIVDTAADIKTYLDFLSDPSIVAVTISDNAAVGANVAQLTSDATTIVELRNADGTPFHLAISDTAANIQNGIGALVANTSHIGSITASGGPASFSTAVFAADQPTLNKIVGGFGIKDTAAKVSGSLDALQGDVADIASIKFSDASPPTLNISSAQLSADAAALAKIASPYILDVANASGSSSYIGYGNGLVFNIGGGTTSTIKGGGLNESFVFAAGFKAATISEFATHNGVAANDTISLAKSDFADWATLLSDAHTGAGGSISFVSQTSGATLTLAGVSVSAFEKVGAPYHSEFTFHA
uniref:hypothetical protein n=1 Tax=uncultured Rhodoblastus sp. TaxID=543037 RepID=UPI0025D15636